MASAAGHMWIFLTMASVAAAQFQLGADKAWAPVAEDSQFAKVRDETQNWRDEDSTECFSYSERFAAETVFCDHECMRDEDDITKCGGPWYCSKTVICQNDRHLRINDEGPLQRDCIIVRGCANHTDCFPTDGRAQDFHVVRPPGGFGDMVEKIGAKFHFGGFKMRTYCCTNDDDYNYVVDQPCNAAVRTTTSLLLIIIPAAVLLASWILRNYD